MTRAHARAERVDMHETHVGLRLVDQDEPVSDRERRERTRAALAAFEGREPIEPFDHVEIPADRDPETGRRTVRISGRPDPAPRRRPSPAANRISARPDRVAMWALMLCLLLAGMSAATAKAAEPAAGGERAAQHAPAR